ncbi:MAG TPA: aldolase/citrate lyase family protein [Puia sp.]|jgi:2-dehydro-3-deoxyglucarate aldolase/4-hydroxy-2-oxoheptanedioate aldolase|nr:aldolase/citrate lyase family protein [Puia sp.]
MKAAALRAFRRKLAATEPVMGLWVTLESPSITEMAVALGLDWVVIDAEHGHLDWAEIVAHIRAAVRCNTIVLVRIAELQEGLIKRALDLGADGVVVPHVETAEALQTALAYARYPPEGVRGIGAERATGWGQCFTEHIREANENVLVVPLIESVKGGDHIGSMLEVPGAELFFFGPADYCASAGYAGDWDNPVVNAHMEEVKAQIIRAGRYCGIVTNGEEDMQRRKKEGFRMLACGLDAALLLKSLKQVLAAAGHECRITPDLSPYVAAVDITVAAAVPPDLQPSRPERITERGEGVTIELAPGVTCEALVGEFTNAVNLFTAIVTFAPGASIPAHSHPHGESITLISGTARVEADQRGYTLFPFDNITVSRDNVHSVRNLSAHDPAVFHIAMPVVNPVRTLAEDYQRATQQVPDDFNGQMGTEHITRYKTARRYSSGKYTEFIDYFNDSLLPGIGMSGGYALFYQDGRLPAHLHDFDESICIVEGEATCFVEGRRYRMSGLSTAIQPRGRVHYFINHSRKPMAMIWVYAGPRPERIEVEDDLATVGVGR